MIKRLKSWLLAALCQVAFLSKAAAVVADPGSASISGIRTHGTNLLVTVRFPAGSRRVLLESRSRFHRGAWTPRAVALPGILATESEFTLPMTESAEAMRAVVDDADSLPLPVGFYAGLRDFEAEIRNSQPVSADPLIRFGSIPGTTDSMSGSDAAPDRQVSESDIWKFSGSTLYFYNQLRGLQVVDVSNPAAPVLRGRLPLASYGEQMYVLRAPAPGGDWLALLAQPECRWDATSVRLVRSSGGRPEAGPDVELPGRLIESRLIGDVLVLATQGWTNRSVLVTNIVAGNGVVFGQRTAHPASDTRLTNVVSLYVSEPFTMVSSLDLSDPLAPVVRSSIRMPDSPTAIHATDRLLFVATSSNGSGWIDRLGFGQPVTTNSVEVFEVSDRSGLLRRAGSFNTAGRVSDKFKFGLGGEVLTVVSQVEARWDGPAGGFRQSRVVLETFSLADPQSPSRLGLLNLVTNENVFATRFDSGRAYVVTFRQVDPLWIVDLADPTRPFVRGELEVPGWSTYIEPMGDRLLAMGAEQGRAAVSLFDVSNPSAPSLLSKVHLGDGWSWSEANSDEKAFRVFADRGLVLLPWHGLRGTNGWFQGMQLMQFGRDSLALRGTVSHESQARRATLVGDHVLSLSSGELVSAGIADLDRPVVVSVLDLSRPVDRVFVQGDRLVQVASGRWTGGTGGGGYGPATVGLSTSDAPDTLLASLDLDEKPVVGADLRDGLLYLLRRGNDTYRTEAVLQTNEVRVWRPLPPILRTVTNAVVTSVPQPPVEVCDEMVRTVEIPASPGSPSYVTNIVVRRCIWETVPPSVVTNWIVVRHEEWQAPVLETNSVVVTNLVGVSVPGETVFDVLRVEGSGLRRLGSVAVTNSPAAWGGFLYEAHWMAPGVLAFVGRGGAYPLYAMADMAAPVGRFPWGIGWGGADILAFDVSHPEMPLLASRIDLPQADQDRVFVAGAKLFTAATTSEWVPPVGGGTNRIADLPWWDRQGSWHSHHSLTVVDFSDATEPVVRAKVPLPGELVGVSHGGHLLYSRTNAWSATGKASASLVALAYDGVGASRVAARALPDPDLGSVPLWVGADGRILVGQAGRPGLETWALTREGTLETYGSVALPEISRRVFEVGPLLVVECDLRLVSLESDPGGLGFRVSATAPRSCGVWLDDSVAAAGSSGSLWIPRGDYGLWTVSFQSP